VNKDKRTYIGYCKNLTIRLRQHNVGRVKATKYRRPLKTLYFERVVTLSDAKNRERYWKSGAVRRKLLKFLQEGFPSNLD